MFGVLFWVLSVGMAVIGFIFIVFMKGLVHINVVEGALICIGSYMFFKKSVGIHPVFCICIAIAMMYGVIKLNSSKIGYWILSSVFCFLYAIITAVIMYIVHEGDIIWTAFGFVAALGFTAALHLAANVKVLHK